MIAYIIGYLVMFFINVVFCEYYMAKTYGNDYRIEFDRLKQAGVRYDWYALEKWIQPVENTLMTVDFVKK